MFAEQTPLLTLLLTPLLTPLLTLLHTDSCGRLAKPLILMHPW